MYRSCRPSVCRGVWMPTRKEIECTPSCWFCNIWEIHWQLFWNGSSLLMNNSYSVVTLRPNNSRCSGVTWVFCVNEWLLSGTNVQKDECHAVRKRDDLAAILQNSRTVSRELVTVLFRLLFIISEGSLGFLALHTELHSNIIQPSKKSGLQY